MQTPIHSNRGSLLIGAAVLVAIFAIFVGGLLTYVSGEYRLNVRSHQYTQALHLAEASVEVGMDELNYAYSLGTNGFTTGRGWVYLGSGAYSRNVIISNSANQVVGTLSNIVYTSANPISVTGVGTAANTLSSLSSVSRAVNVVMATSSLFPMALITKGPLTFNKSAIVIDSYDSTDWSHFPSGFYNSANRLYNGNIATTDGSSAAVTFSKGSPDIYGTIQSGPGGTISGSGSALIGPAASGSQVGIGNVPQLVANGWFKSGFTASIPDVPPANLASAANLGTINMSSGASTMTIGSGNYQVNALNVAGNNCLTINGIVNMYIHGNVNVSNGGSLTITPGSTLVVYVGGPTVNLSGAGLINNSVQPKDNQWFGLPTMNTATITASGNYIGAAYFPDAAVTISGAGDFSGALISSSVTFAGSGSFHYDQSLGSRPGNGSFYTIAAWREMQKNSSGVWK